MDNEVLILSGVRTPIGAFGGSLSSVPATKLGAVCIKAALEKAKVPFDHVDEVVMGNVISGGLGQNPARQAAIKSGLDVAVGATTVNRVCGSGMKAAMMGSQSIRLGDADVIVAGGMENMSLAPYLLPKARHGYWLGNGILLDAMIHDGLWDVYCDEHMGSHGDRCAVKCRLSRQQQDDFAVRSYERARQAAADGVFDDEIVPVEISDRNGSTIVMQDEEPSRFNEEKLRALRPAFNKDGTVTAGNASSINDGAAALVLASRSYCNDLGAKPLARIVGATTFSREPEWFTLAPIDAVKNLMERLQLSVDDVDLFEINEAFSVVTLAAEQTLKISPEKLNIYGGAVALGHPIGCSGARLLVTLLNGLRRTRSKRGIACLCIGGGEAIAMAVETFSPE